jgi:MarR family transcriptional regulator, transcriptional regulator for hemolysin
MDSESKRNSTRAVRRKGLLPNHSGHHINRIARLSTRWLEPKLEELGLAVAQIPVFGAIKLHGPLTQKELAGLLFAEQPTVAQLLARMERDGLVVRIPDPNDGRSSLIHLTPKALRKAEPAHALLLDGNRILLKGFSAKEIEILDGLLLRARSNLEEALNEET